MSYGRSSITQPNKATQILASTAQAIDTGLDAASLALDSTTKPQSPIHHATQYGQGIVMSDDMAKPSEIDPSRFNFLDDIVNIVGGFIIGTLNIPAYLINLIDKPTTTKNGKKDEANTYRHPLTKLGIGVFLTLAWPFAVAHAAYKAPYLDEEDEASQLTSFERLQKRWHVRNWPEISFFLVGPNTASHKAANVMAALGGLARLAFNFAVGLIWGCVKAPLLALQNVFINRNYHENIFMQIIKTPFRFAYDLVTTPLNTAIDWAHNEARILAVESNVRKTALAQQYKEKAALVQQQLTMRHKPLDYVKAVFGFIVGAAISPLNGLRTVLNPQDTGYAYAKERGQDDVSFLQKLKSPFRLMSGYRDTNGESFLQWLVKAPFRFVRGVVESPFIIATKGYGPGVPVNLEGQVVTTFKPSDVGTSYDVDASYESTVRRGAESDSEDDVDAQHGHDRRFASPVPTASVHTRPHIGGTSTSYPSNFGSGSPTLHASHNAGHSSTHTHVPQHPAPSSRLPVPRMGGSQQ
jgi:hypothetical protein